MKKNLKAFLITIIVGGAIFLVINNFIGLDDLSKKDNKSNSNSNVVVENKKETVIINYKMYQKLRSEMYEEEVFAIAIMKTDDEISSTYRDELLYSFKDKNIIIYEIDIDKLDESDLSSVIKDVSELMKYKEPSLVTPSLIISKKGKVNCYEGLKYSTELNEIIKDNEIE